MNPKLRKSSNLSEGRTSLPGRNYYVTVCTKNRQALLMQPDRIIECKNSIRVLHLQGDLNVFCGVIMPDHIHLLFKLTGNRKLTKLISKLKADLSRKFRGKNTTSKSIWQRNFHDHLLRSESNLEDFAFYTFMNPYKNQLLPTDETWQGWFCNKQFHPEFLTKLQQGKYPHKEWMKHTDGLSDLLQHDE